MQIANSGYTLQRTAVRPALGAGARAPAARPPLLPLVAASNAAESPASCSPDTAGHTRRRLILGAGSCGAAGVLGALPAVAAPPRPLEPGPQPAGSGTLLPTLVDVEWLRRQPRDTVKLLDAAWHPNVPGFGALAYQVERIPGAGFFDLESIADTTTSPGLPLMLPSPAAFGAAADALGISPHDTVVVYDGRAPFGQFTAPRAWWMWHVMGHARVAVLDGGLPAWEAAGGALDSAPISPRLLAAPALVVQSSSAAAWRPRYQARLQADAVRGWQDMVRSIDGGWEQIVDARPADRYHGHLPEAPGVRAGHISGAINLPAASLLSEGRFLPPAELRARFAAAGVDLARPMVVYCMTGIQAATVALAAQLAAPGARCAVYDGGWNEWGRMAGIASMAVLPSASTYN